VYDAHLSLEGRRRAMKTCPARWVAIASVVGLFVCYGGDDVGVETRGLSTDCVRGAGYWKSHPEAWPVQSLALGPLELAAPLIAKVLAGCKNHSCPPQIETSQAMLRQLIAASFNAANASPRMAQERDLIIHR